MDYDIELDFDKVKIHCTNGLETFSKEFIQLYKENIDRINDRLGIEEEKNLLIELTDDERSANFVYGVSDFSGFFTESGMFAYLNPNGEKGKDYLMKGILHEITHHLYKFYVYGEKNSRITWVDEGLAQFISGQREDWEKEEKYPKLLEKYLKDCEEINLNDLKHSDQSFGDQNGYPLSFIAIYYLYQNHSKEEFQQIIRTPKLLIDYGEHIIKDMKDYYFPKRKQK